MGKKDLPDQIHQPAYQSGGNQGEDDARKQHSFCVKPFLVIGLVHVLGSFNPEHPEIGEQNPVQKAVS